MTKETARTVILSTIADFSNGMATAWAFASYNAIFHLASGLFNSPRKGELANKRINPC